MLRFGRVRATHLPGYWCVPSSGCDCCHGPTLIPVVLLERLMVCVLWLFVVTDQMPLRCNRSLSLVSASSSIVISFGLPHTPCTANADFTTKCNVNVHYYVRKWLVQYVTGYRRLAAIRAWQLLGGGGGARLSSVSCSCSPVELFKTTLKNVREPPAKQECQWRIVSGWFLIGRVQLYANILHLCSLADFYAVLRFLSKLFALQHVYLTAENIKINHELLCHFFVDLMNLTYIIVY